MGQGSSKESYKNAVKKLSSIELANIEAVFNEISTKREDGTRHVELSLINRQDFAERFRLPGFIAERLFHAFDRNESGTIDLEEFIGGIALCLHGKVKDKCRLLFHIFNLSDDDGVSRDELTAVLLSSLESAQTILDNVEETEQPTEGNNTDKLIETVSRIVSDAFDTCNVSKTGKLSAKEFEHWLYRNPKIMDNVFGWQCPSPEEGQWMNESSPEASPTKTKFSSILSDESVQSVEIQGVPSEQSDNRTLSDLFSSNTSTSGDAEGHSFFDSLVAPAASDPFSQIGGQTFPPSVVFSEPIHQPSEKQSAPEPAQGDLGFKVVNNQDTIKQDSEQWPPFQGAETPMPPVAPILSQTSVAHDDPLNAMQNQESSNLKLEITKEQKLPSAPPTPEGEWVRSKQTEAERRSSAWIATPQTNQFLVTIGSGMLNPADVDQQFLTSPGLVIEGPQVDPVKELMSKFMGEQDAENRKTLSVDSVPLDESGLRELLRQQCWRAALEFTTRFLTAHGQGVGQKGQRALHTHKTLQVWLSSRWLLVTTTSAQKRLCGYFGFVIATRNVKAPNNRNKSFSNFVSSIFSAAIELWITREVRVLYSIGNCFLGMKDYSLAVTVFKSIMDKDPSCEFNLLSGIGRIYLQLGDLETAQSYFKQVESKATGDPNSLSSVVMNKGLLALSAGSYDEAHRHFVAATKLDPYSSVAINNVAVCLLFLGKLKEALSLLERIIWKDPETNLQEGLLFNLCAIYELESSHSMQKKQKLLELVAKHRGDGFNTSFLKIA
ncbi:uncharacterized protein LOC113681535 [Pocillopora damicornis]|uniref:uncharacterized protein LOC113681535 n=1 Tax=Pocillopora damicornis TaxID=46731 RepID=UPI000F554E98|nr:uncharacterized protein LOC113681535 [Pocillopora damicornis]